jgi:hypothetical protein
VDESRGLCAAPWTSIGFDVSEAVPLTAPSIAAAQALETRSMCGLLDLARSSRGPRRLSASASASASGLGSAHGPYSGPLSSAVCRGEMGHRGPSREAEPRLLQQCCCGGLPGLPVQLVRRTAALPGPGRIRGGFARWARRPAGGEARAQDGGASRCQFGPAPTWRLDLEWEARRGS